MEHVQVEEINIGPSDAIVPVDSVTALAGNRLRGDRHFFADGAAAGGPTDASAWATRSAQMADRADG